MWDSNEDDYYIGAPTKIGKIGDPGVILWDMERYGAETACLVKEGKREYVKYYDAGGKEKEYRWARFPEGCASWMTLGKRYTKEDIENIEKETK